MGCPEEEQEEEVAVLADTNVGTRLAVSVPPDITAADFKRILERAHFACFPDFGEISIEGVMVRRKSCLYHLPNVVPLKCFFWKKQSSWILHVSIRCLGCTIQPCRTSEKNRALIVDTITGTNGCDRDYAITEGENCSCQILLPSMPCNNDCNLSEQRKMKRIRKHFSKDQHSERFLKKMDDDLVANGKDASVEYSCAISSDILSVGGINTRYFTDFSEVTSSDRSTSPYPVSKSVKSLPRTQLGAKVDHGCLKIQLENATTSPPLSIQQDNMIPSDHIRRCKVRRSLLKANTELETFCSPQRPLISLFKTEGARTVAISPSSIKFSIFEIREDDD